MNEKSSLKNKLESNKVKIAVASGAGIVLGTAGVFAANTFVKMDDEGETMVVNEDGLQFATGVNDSMSFEEAFDAARNEIGEGGCFVWHGKVFSTYTSEEWDNLSDEEKAQFASTAFGDDIDFEKEDSAHEQASATPTQQTHTTHASSAKAAATSEEQSTEPKTTAQASTPADDNDDDDDIHVLSVQQEQVGDTVVITAETVEQGVHYTYIDVDLDEKFDYKFADANHDGELQDNEVQDLHGQDVTVSSMTALAAQQIEETEAEIQNYQAEVETLPDYTNDADVSDLA